MAVWNYRKAGGGASDRQSADDGERLRAGRRRKPAQGTEQGGGAQRPAQQNGGMEPPPRQPRGPATGAAPRAPEARIRGAPAESGRRAPGDARGAGQRKHEADPAPPTRMRGGAAGASDLAQEQDLPDAKRWKQGSTETPRHHLPASRHGLRRPLLRRRRGAGWGWEGLRWCGLGSPVAARKGDAGEGRSVMVLSKEMCRVSF
uniref:Uncharacterized protein n=1 Tax=Aegilops tauschii subsp. strangulata TaxID=200361 RepID=A0A453CUI6_AEGTS